MTSPNNDHIVGSSGGSACHAFLLLANTEMTKDALEHFSGATLPKHFSNMPQRFHDVKRYKLDRDVLPQPLLGCLHILPGV
jgi:hypothetical protein